MERSSMWQICEYLRSVEGLAFGVGQICLNLIFTFSLAAAEIAFGSIRSPVHSLLV